MDQLSEFLHTLDSGRLWHVGLVKMFVQDAIAGGSLWIKRLPELEGLLVDDLAVTQTNPGWSVPADRLDKGISIQEH
tara:strand:+ start:2231 stop:2461 length:231 start_codon:yes stop_codon:yes gene_type:complete